ncbi:rhomboid family intramembrane serine protease [Acinetobacter sichuanensis]|uniref:Rhomboid family intramembrane serine protease n=1 Tax=Acinetobacter sichuanensis TaxID=2136183 RepID=A0A371YS90_9GAMM|nr:MULTISPECIES: rhomboid family intramembrane serine protease [Acinetobacter]MDM1246391.1 rhomboid family intramembrane serine protease [Acinetobacter sp. R933-2]MDM1762896.1 rhomboid family intramembrane serine protease [Acinetobacter sp. 226-1]MDM1766375.1 rhomboid family intramembrane serine protease [Acinetobacter sp. 226-4]MDQ9020702.1 rhomboid family intramembrane serine protease [Acinetobacter sichuanensis]RFC84343.1 rhomboid family intramembrane serine protease [Acinetobacter sichuane
MLHLPFNHTITIILITVIISLIAFSNRQVLDRFIFWPPAIQQKSQYDRFITHGFIHADGMHLLFNMFTLFFFGSIIESFYRQYLYDLGFVLFYLGGLIFAILPSYLKHKNDTRWASLGASGAVSAVLFAYILFQPWKLIFVFFIPVPAIIFAVLYVAYSIWSGKKGNSNINHSAHLWGAAYGVIMTIIIEPRVVPHFFNQLMQLPF